MEKLFHERLIPPPAVKPTGTVLDYHFKDTAGVLVPPFNTHCDDLSANSGGFPEGGLVDAAGVATIFIPARAVQQEIPERGNFQPGQLRRAF
jgi:hypothetical protein